MFFLLAAAIGLVLGGSQALSRSLFSQFIPLGREAEYFGLYEISDGATSLVGSLPDHPHPAGHPPTGWPLSRWSCSSSPG